MTAPSSSASGSASDKLHALDDLVEVVDIDLDRLARGERGAGLQPARVGASREIAEQGQAELCARRRGARCTADAAKADLVAHDVTPD